MTRHLFLPLVALALAADVGALQPTPHGAAPRTSMIQPRARGVCATTSRRQLLERTAARAAVGFLAVPRVAFASPASPAVGSDLPAGVVVLRVAEVTEKMEQVVLQAAMYQQQGEGEEIVIGRPQMQQSIKVLLEKTQLESMPNSKAAVQELRSISSIAGEGQGPLAGRELKDIARAYNRARDALRLVFESFSEAERDECKQIFRQMQAQDRARLESAQIQ